MEDPYADSASYNNPQFKSSSSYDNDAATYQ